MRLVGPDKNNLSEKVEVPIAQAAYPAPFAHALEFNPPAHGTWNIVHIGMNVPESQQIYVCAKNCMRGVVLTAAEMNRASRFSFVILKEEDLLEGTVEDITIEGVADVIRKLPKRPPAVCLFTVCTHHFLGCDIKRIYRELGQQFPDIDFIQGFMDPIMQKEGLTPDQKLRIAMYRPLEAQEEQTSCPAGGDAVRYPGQQSLRVSVLGSNISMRTRSDLIQFLIRHRVLLTQAPDCASYREFKNMGHADLFLGVVPNGRIPAERTASRLGKTSLYLPLSFSYEENADQLKSLGRTIRELHRTKQLPCSCRNLPDHAADLNEEEYENWLNQWIDRMTGRCEKALKQTFDLIGNAPVRIDYTAHPRPLGLARLLLEHGFHVDKIYLNAVSGEEKADFEWLQKEYPELLLCATIQPLNRVLPRVDGKTEKILAIGQQAAWFSGTAHFVNIVEGGDLQGFDGICGMAERMREAWEQEKDTRDLIPRKGLGCESCV